MDPYNVFDEPKYAGVRKCPPDIGWSKISLEPKLPLWFLRQCYHNIHWYSRIRKFCPDDGTLPRIGDGEDEISADEVRSFISNYTIHSYNAFKNAFVSGISKDKSSLSIYDQDIIDICKRMTEYDRIRYVGTMYDRMYGGLRYQT